MSQCTAHKPTPLVRRVCGWCDKTLGWKSGTGGDTHGVCPPCYDALIAKMRAK